jgi:hypothetical protein
MQRLLDSIPEECLNRYWYETFDADSFAVVWNTLPRNIQKELDAGLDGVRLAVTGAHGDFRDRHVFIDADRAYKLIDWEYYNAKGSVVTDILRLYSIRAGAANKMNHLDPAVLERSGLPIEFPAKAFGGGPVPGLRALGLLSAVEYACKRRRSALSRAHRIASAFAASASPVAL